MLASCAVCVVATTAVVNSSADLPVKALTLSWVCPSALSILTKYIKLICRFLKKRCFLVFIEFDCLFMVILMIHAVTLS